MTRPVHVDCDNSPILTLIVIAILSRGRLMCNALQLAYGLSVTLLLMLYQRRYIVTCKGTTACGEVQATQCADVYHQVHARKSKFFDRQWHAP